MKKMVNPLKAKKLMKLKSQMMLVMLKMEGSMEMKE